MTKRNKISNEVREDAAVLCAAMADWLGGWSANSMIAPRHAWQGTDVYVLSLAAAEEVSTVAWGLSIAEVWREAGGLIADGWCPGDPVERRKVSP